MYFSCEIEYLILSMALVLLHYFNYLEHLFLKRWNRCICQNEILLEPIFISSFTVKGLGEEQVGMCLYKACICKRVGAIEVGIGIEKLPREEGRLLRGLSIYLDTTDSKNLG